MKFLLTTFAFTRRITSEQDLIIAKQQLLILAQTKQYTIFAVLHRSGNEIAVPITATYSANASQLYCVNVEAVAKHLQSCVKFGRSEV